MKIVSSADWQLQVVQTLLRPWRKCFTCPAIECVSDQCPLDLSHCLEHLPVASSMARHMQEERRATALHDTLYDRSDQMRESGP